MRLLVIQYSTDCCCCVRVLLYLTTPAALLVCDTTARCGSSTRRRAYVIVPSRVEIRSNRVLSAGVPRFEFDRWHPRTSLYIHSSYGIVRCVVPPCSVSPCSVPSSYSMLLVLRVLCDSTNTFFYADYYCCRRRFDGSLGQTLSLFRTGLLCVQCSVGTFGILRVLCRVLMSIDPPLNSSDQSISLIYITFEYYTYDTRLCCVPYEYKHINIMLVDIRGFDHNLTSRAVLDSDYMLQPYKVQQQH